MPMNTFVDNCGEVELYEMTSYMYVQFKLYFGIFSAIRLRPSHFFHSGKLEVHHGGEWKMLYVKYWNEELGNLACRQLGFPGLIKNLDGREYKHYYDYNNFNCQNIKDTLVCCPTKKKDRNEYPSISQVAVACEQGKFTRGIIWSMQTRLLQ